MRWLNKKGNDIITFVDESLYVDYTTNTWWIDSGATVYVANSLQGFATKMTLRKGERKIRVANGVEVEAEAVGILLGLLLWLILLDFLRTLPLIFKLRIFRLYIFIDKPSWTHMAIISSMLHLIFIAL